jgi:SAM-dependent methyltransferase
VTGGSASVPRDANWSEDLVELHEGTSRDHFLDLRTRTAMLEAVGPISPSATVVEIGCSSGYMLEDLRTNYPLARLAGFDIVGKALRTARELAPEALIALADARNVPVPSASADIVLSANVLEHIEQDEIALSEIRRVLRPNGRAALVVPAGPDLFDYYDRYLRHERRYARGELTAKARGAGLKVIRESFLGTFIYPPFWLVKKYNRIRYEKLDSAAVAQKVAKDIRETKNSLVGRMACSSEQFLDRRGVRLPFGVRILVLLTHPGDDGP